MQILLTEFIFLLITLTPPTLREGHSCYQDLLSTSQRKKATPEVLVPALREQQEHRSVYRSGEEQDFHMVRNITLNTQEELTRPFPKHFFDAAPLLTLPQQGEGGRQPKLLSSHNPSETFPLISCRELTRLPAQKVSRYRMTVDLLPSENAAV